MSARLDTISWTPKARVLQFSPDQVAYVARKAGVSIDAVTKAHLDAYLDAPDAVSESNGNLLTTAGLNRLTNLIIGGGGAAMTNAQMIVGVGATATAAAIGDTHLGSDGASAYYQGSDSSFPTQSNGLISGQATFTSSNGNFAWNEWCWAIGTSTITPGATLASVATSPVMINHKAPATLGTKVSGAIWVLQTSVTLS